MKTLKNLSLVTTAMLISCIVSAKEFSYPLKGDQTGKTLKVINIASHIEVLASDESEIHLEMDGFKPLPEKAQGLRPLLSSGTDNTDLGLSLSVSKENPNLLILNQVRRNPGKTLKIKLPGNIALDLHAHINHGFEVSGMEGEVAATTLNGDIQLTEVAGPIVINSTNGQIDVNFSKFNHDFPSSVQTVNGEINLVFNGDEKINFDMSVIQGEIFTDLEVDTERTSDDMHTLMSNREMKATLNGGGVDFKISTINGQIYLRKSK